MTVGSVPSPAGEKLKAELKRRRISQKDFAGQLGMRPSHLSEIVNGKRPISLQTAHKLQLNLGIPIRVWMDLEVKHNIDTQKVGNEREEVLAREEIMLYDEVVSVKDLLKRVGVGKVDSKQSLAILQKAYSLPPAKELTANLLCKGFFKKSAKTGLDSRMIATWVVLARASVKEQTNVSQFDGSSMSELAATLSQIFNENNNTIIRTHDALAQHGIKFSIVERIGHASIDGYSFIDDGVPAIVVARRFDRIDNFAFAVLHEVCHVYKHLNGNRPQMISIADYDNESCAEREANDFASVSLVNPRYWADAPTVQLSNPWDIQRKYASWAEMHNLNKWIVLGQISYMTGMYKFRADDSRKIH